MAAFDKEYKKLEGVITHLTDLEDNPSLSVNQVELEMKSLQSELQDITDYVKAVMEPYVEERFKRGIQEAKRLIQRIGQNILGYPDLDELKREFSNDDDMNWDS